MALEEKIFKVFPIISPWELHCIDHKDVANLNPCMGYGWFREDFKRISHYKSMGAVCHGNQSSNPISPKTLCSTQVQTFSTVGEPSRVLRHKTTGLALVNARELPK